MNRTIRTIPNRFPVPENQEPDHQHKPPAFRLSDLNGRGIAVIIVAALVCLIGWAIIKDLSNLGSNFGSAVMSWFRDGSINPENRRGFTFFLRLLFTAGFIWLLLSFSKRK